MESLLHGGESEARVRSRREGSACSPSLMGPSQACVAEACVRPRILHTDES